MVTKIKKGDFVEFDFVGRVKASNQIFDLSNAEVAKKEGVFHEGHEYKPLQICVGAGHVISGLDESLVGKEIGKEYEVDIPAEKAFGKRDQRLIQLTSLSVFKKKNIHPVPGMQLNLDGRIATVRSVNGGRVIIDFNPTLAGRDLSYKIKPLQKITDVKKKAGAIFKTLGFTVENLQVKDTELILNLENKEKLGKDFLKLLETEVKKNVPEIKKVTFK